MIKAKTICSKCFKVKKDDCDRCKASKGMNTINQNNYKLYNSTKWRKFSKQFKVDNPLCVKCLQEGRTTPSYYTDHIKSINSGGAIWDKTNLQALCKSCNASKTSYDRQNIK